MPSPGRTPQEHARLLTRVGTLLNAGLSQKAVSRRLGINERDVRTFMEIGGFERLYPQPPVSAPTWTPVTARPQYNPMRDVLFRDAMERVAAYRAWPSLYGD